MPLERGGPWTIARIYQLFPRLEERKLNRGRQLSGGEQEMLSIARVPGGGFRHAEQDKGGPYLADNVEMAKALIALHRSTGDRAWLTRASATADFVAKTFIDPATGGFIASASPDAQQLVRPIKQREDKCDRGSDVQPVVLLHRREPLS